MIVLLMKLVVKKTVTVLFVLTLTLTIQIIIIIYMVIKQKSQLVTGVGKMFY